jgi:hypothetical protein
MNELVKVHSHPRSGTHYLKALLANNFYRDCNLSSPGGEWGHWSQRRWIEGEPHGKLSGFHTANPDPTHPAIYLYRDGRAVALSIWRSRIGFLHKDWADITFSDFLRRPLDWQDSPGQRSTPQQTIAEEWWKHVHKWLKTPPHNVLPVRYEEAVCYPYETLYRVAERFGLDWDGKARPVEGLVGQLPNQGQIDAWKGFFTLDDLHFFHRHVPVDSPYLWQLVQTLPL